MLNLIGKNVVYLTYIIFVLVFLHFLVKKTSKFQKTAESVKNIFEFFLIFFWFSNHFVISNSLILQWMSNMPKFYFLVKGVFSQRAE